MMKKESFKEHENYYLSRLIDGDKNAFNFIFHQYYQPLCLYAYQFVTFEDVEEIVQDGNIMIHCFFIPVFLLFFIKLCI